jgi:hexosaminidase
MREHGWMICWKNSVVGRLCAIGLFALSLLACGSDQPALQAVVDDDSIAPLQLIPKPRTVSGDTGHLHLSAASRIVVTSETRSAGELLGAVLRPSTGFTWEVVLDNPSAADIVLRLEDGRGDLGDEGYAMEVTAHGVLITAATQAGVFYGTQTLIQLLPAEIERTSRVEDVVWKAPMVTIEDAPRFAWRGMMLDVSRHFFTVDEVKRLIDLAVRYKINRFHLHLTDDQGWRIEIEAWPNLTAIGSTIDYSGGRGGYYTKADFSDIVAYAEARFVTIVPEIDMPGHTNAALASYGELNESGEPTALTPTIPFGSSSLWTDGPITAQFVDEVIGEVAALIPGAYFHIGGDEAAATEPQDYVEFIEMVQQIVQKHGKIMVGWEEIGRANLEPPFLAQHWFAPASALQARDQGARLIASPAANAYLDMKYDESTPIGLTWAGFTDVRDAYEWDPVSQGLVEGDIVGLEAPLWTETVDSLDDIEFMVFPRLLGYAEIGWSRREDRGWDEYRVRLADHGRRLAARNVSFFESPLVDWPAPLSP